MKRLKTLALVALLPVFASAAGTATVRVTNAGSVPIVVAGRTVRPASSEAVSVPAGESGTIAVSAPDGWGFAAPAAYPSLRIGATYSLRLSPVRGATTSPAIEPVLMPPPLAPPPGANPESGSGKDKRTIFEVPNTRTFSPVPEPSPEEVVRIELKSRPLDAPLGVGDSLRTGAEIVTGRDVARHDHVFVFDGTGMLVDNLGWTGTSGGQGEVFSDDDNFHKYDTTVQRSVEMTWGEYKAAREAFREQTGAWRYELANAATMEAKRTVSIGGGMAAGGIVLGVPLGAALAYLRREARAIARSSEFRTPMKENDISGREPDEELAETDPALRACYPGVNCQLWADNFFSYLEYVKKILDDDGTPAVAVSSGGEKAVKRLEGLRDGEEVMKRFECLLDQWIRLVREEGEIPFRNEHGVLAAAESSEPYRPTSAEEDSAEALLSEMEALRPEIARGFDALFADAYRKDGRGSTDIMVLVSVRLRHRPFLDRDASGKWQVVRDFWEIGPVERCSSRETARFLELTRDWAEREATEAPQFGYRFKKEEFLRAIRNPEVYRFVYSYKMADNNPDRNGWDAPEEFKAQYKLYFYCLVASTKEGPRILAAGECDLEPVESPNVSAEFKGDGKPVFGFSLPCMFECGDVPFFDRIP